METSTIQYWRDRFNNYRDESSDPDENDSSKDKVTPDEEAATAATAANEQKNFYETPKAYKILGDRKYSHCGFMKIMVPKNVSLGDSLFICFPF